MLMFKISILAQASQNKFNVSLKENCPEESLHFYLLLRCTGALQGSLRNLLGFNGAVGGSLVTAISHGRIGDVVQTSHTLGKETV